VRTSYQDSNIFGYKDNYDVTVQASATNEETLKMRNNPTFSSKNIISH
jgi:hypothetical protein